MIGIENFDNKHRPESFVEGMTDCWTWQGFRDRDGYGVFRVGTKTKRAHRVAYEAAMGEIPQCDETGSRIDIDHLCRVRHCVRPDHLEAVTHQENTRRGNTIAARSAAVTHCPSGHEYAGQNLLVGRDGKRRCRACRAAQRARAAA